MRHRAEDYERSPDLIAMLNRIMSMIEAECAAFATAHDGIEPDVFLLLSHGADMETYTSTDDFNALSDDLEAVVIDWIKDGLIEIADAAPESDTPRLQ